MRTWIHGCAVLLLAGCAQSSAKAPDASHADASVTADAATPQDGSTALDAAPHEDAAVSPKCALPPETGPCRAAFQRYYFDPKTDACRPFVYGGCSGNANNFETAIACLDACAPSGDAGISRPAACKVGDNVYPSGATGIKDPHSCNTCNCMAGQLSCTKIGCPAECPPNAKPSTGCAACGPVDNCEIVEHKCFIVCSTASECATSGYSVCVDNVCKDVCG